MPILNIKTQQIGEVGVLPSIAYISTNNTKGEVLATGYLNNAVQLGKSFQMPCIAVVSTIASAGAQPQVGWYQVSHVGANWSLVDDGGPGDVILPTTLNHIATYTNTTGTLSEDAATAINAGNIQAGLSGTAGTLISFPTTAANGSLIISALNAGGAFNTTIRNSTMGQSTVYSIPDIGAATGGMVVSTGAVRLKSVAAAAAAGGNADQSFTDAFCTTGSVVIGNWVTQTTPASVIKIVPGNGSFVVTSSADAGVGTFSYVIQK